MATSQEHWRARRRSGSVRAVLDGREVRHADLTVAAGGDGRSTVPRGARLTAGAFSVIVDDPDGLPADDTRFVVAGRTAITTALIVTLVGRCSGLGGETAGALLVPRARRVSGGEVDVVPTSGSQSIAPRRLRASRGRAALDPWTRTGRTRAAHGLRPRRRRTRSLRRHQTSSRGPRRDDRLAAELTRE